MTCASQAAMYTDMCTAPAERIIGAQWHLSPRQMQRRSVHFTRVHSLKPGCGSVQDTCDKAADAQTHLSGSTWHPLPGTHTPSVTEKWITGSPHCEGRLALYCKRLSQCLKASALTGALAVKGWEDRHILRALRKQKLPTKRLVQE